MAGGSRGVILGVNVVVGSLYISLSLYSFFLCKSINSLLLLVSLSIYKTSVYLFWFLHLVSELCSLVIKVFAKID